MKAIVQTSYGSSDVLSLKEIERPNLQEHEVLVRVHAASVNAGDAFTMKGSPWIVRLTVGFPRPKDHVLGWDVAGRVAAVGPGVTHYRPGDSVFGECSGAFAEYASAPEGNIAPAPSNLTFAEAATIPTAALTALQGLRDAGNLEAGQKVLINGAAGGVGIFAVQIAKILGANVTGVCSTRNVDMVTEIGADHVIDYTRDDFTRGQKRYDIILDNVANHSFADLRRALTPEGVILPNSGHGGVSYFFKAFLLSAFVQQQGRPFVMKSSGEDLRWLKNHIESGAIKPVMDRSYRLEEIGDALTYVSMGHARGKVAVLMDGIATDDPLFGMDPIDQAAPSQPPESMPFTG